MSLNGKTALITGSSRGIGRGIALKLAELGVKIAIHYYQNELAAKESLAQVRERGSDGFIIQADISRPEEVSHLFKQTQSEFKMLDIFVSNARPEAHTFYKTPMDITLKEWDIAFNSQSKAFLVGVQEASKIMREGSRIIAITYSAGSRTGSWQPWVGMGSAKAAVETLMRYFAVALASRGITVNAISPGPTQDGLLDSLPEQTQDLIKEWHTQWSPMGRLGTPADIGNAVALLCMEEASWITGQIICADGGISLMNPELPLELQLG